MNSRKLLGQCLQRRVGRYVDLEPLLERLREGGWTEERLAKNDLAPRRGPGGSVYSYRAFWITIARLATELARLDLPPIFIKCVREYRYSDSNVDVLVPRSMLRDVARVLYDGPWSAPDTRDAVEQLLIERAKLKLPSDDPEYLAAHLYGGVSWRYQDDIGLLRVGGRSENPEHLEQVTIGELAGICPDLASSEVKVWIPNDAAEFVLQAAHVAFENYRMTLGEAIHFRLLRERARAAWDRAMSLARSVGCVEALLQVDGESQRICSKLFDLDPADYPRTLPLHMLVPAFSERAALLTGRRRFVSAATESFTEVSVYLLVSVIRRLRRLREGAEGYRR